MDIPDSAASICIHTFADGPARAAATCPSNVSDRGAALMSRVNRRPTVTNFVRGLVQLDCFRNAAAEASRSVTCKPAPRYTTAARSDPSTRRTPPVRRWNVRSPGGPQRPLDVKIKIIRTPLRGGEVNTYR
ncbi:hypothetical protein EVAR_6768_1 [Eumeta japonica]|uniref:Uncharacterized protein n=1 Tax=Eumeta variegata TaxID=151549 RepID=A0A4C1V4I4_EUMVA|nr:hypothetical protein EVAR_6768_1 [Eumeta japonica]